jgi:hypothetical protein
MPNSVTFSSPAVFFAKGEANVLPAPANEVSGVDEGLSSDAGHDLFSSATGSAFYGAAGADAL